MVTGDSLTVQWIPHLVDMLGDAAEVVERAHGGTALCDWFERQGDDLGLEHLADWRPHVIVVDHGGNGFTDCMVDHEGADYYEKYRVDAGYVIELAALTDTRVLFLSQPASRPTWQPGPTTSSQRCRKPSPKDSSGTPPPGRSSPPTATSSRIRPAPPTNPDASTVVGCSGHHHPADTSSPSAPGATRCWWPTNW